MRPSAPIAHDLYPMKQRAQNGPHREFPIRTGMEKNYQVKERSGRSLGKLTFSQTLREAYPGAVYYYKDASALNALEAFADFVDDLQPQILEDTRAIERDDEENGSTIIAAGEIAIHESAQGPMQVVVLEHQYTPHGLMYELKPFTEKKNDAVTSARAGCLLLNDDPKNPGWGGW